MFDFVIQQISKGTSYILKENRKIINYAILSQEICGNVLQ